MTIADPAGGGAEREFVNLLKGLPRSEFEVHVVLWRNGIGWTPPSAITREVLGKTRPWHAIRVIRRLIQAFRRFQPDVVFSQLHYVNTLTGIALRMSASNARWTARFVNDPAFVFGPVLKIVAGWALRRCTQVAAASNGAARAIEDVFGFDRGAVIQMDNVVDIAGIQHLAKSATVTRPGAFRFVAVGRLTRQKNYPLLLGAFAAANLDAELLILGTGELEEELKSSARALGIEDKVTWGGFVENPYPDIAAADALVLSSDAEGLPNVLIEAMTLGTPVLSTDCRFGPSELIEHGVTGLLVPTGDKDALAAGLTELVTRPEEALRRATEAQRRAWERFDPNHVVAKYVEVIKGDGHANLHSG